MLPGASPCIYIYIYGDIYIDWKEDIIIGVILSCVLNCSVKGKNNLKFRPN